MDAARLERLLDRYLDEALTTDEKTELEQMLRAEPTARQMFWEHARFHSLLRESGAEGRGRELAELAGAPPARRGWRVLSGAFETLRLNAGWAVAAAAAFIAVVGIWLAWQHGAAPRDQMTSGVAVLTQAVDLEWAPGSESHNTGAALSPGWLRIKSGLAQIEFSDGARVLLEGPAELQIVSRAEAFCRSGRLSAQVPAAARGFKVSSSQMAIVDLGTAFGFETRDGASELHVFEGKVRIENPAAPTHELGAGQALGVDARGTWRQFAAVAIRFPNADALEQKAASAWERRNQAWRASADVLRGDATVMLHYTFESASPFERRLHNAANGAERASDGAIVGCRWAEGRWPGKSALEFKGTGDRVRLELPGAFDALTLAAWVRVDSLDHNYNSLLMADAFDAGGLHWQLTNSGIVQLGIQGPQNRGGQDCKTPVVFTPERFGQWVHLAVVIDRAAHRVVHYVDGQEASSHVLKFDVPLGFGRAEVGNWNPATRRDRTPIRSFNGRMDEMLVFRRALDAQEVRGLARNGPSPQLISP
jgi:ferric-dicitrate binding protein FerR (iron transport regulator)